MYPLRVKQLIHTLLFVFVDAKKAVVAGETSETLAEARRVRRQRKLHIIQIPEDHVMITDELLGKGGFGAVYIADYNGRNAAAKVKTRTMWVRQEHHHVCSLPRVVQSMYCTNNTVTKKPS